MPIAPALRARVRARFAGCCGYYGVAEHVVGNPLEVDHFRPQTYDGDDSFDNLVYCCVACNRYKSDYWPGEAASLDRMLLNPNIDSITAHVVETANGQLVGLTMQGWFHLRLLHLNRPLLVQSRQLRQQQIQYDTTLLQTQQLAESLSLRVEQLEQELANLRTLVARMIEQEPPRDF